MKKFGIFYLAMGLALLLAACGCTHQWDSDGCEAARTCVNCGATEAARGHTWQEVTCESPKTCSLCHATEGEALGHDFPEGSCDSPAVCRLCGEADAPVPHTNTRWIIDGSQMHRSCAVCGLEEKISLDRALYFMDQLAGQWDLAALEKDSGVTSVYDLLGAAEAGAYLSVADDACQWYDGEKIHQANLRFDAYAEEEGLPVYTGTLTPAGGSAMTLWLTDGEEPQLRLHREDGEGMVFQQNRMLADYMTGIWASGDEGTIHTLELNADRSFQTDMDEAVQGTWHIRPLTERFGVRYCEIILPFLKDGEPDSYTVAVNMETPEIPLEEVLRSGLAHVVLNHSAEEHDHGLPMFKTNPETMEELKNSLEAGPNQILGDWTSLRVETFAYSSSVMGRTGTSEMNTDYQVTFREDGTFTLRREQTQEGTWVFTGSDLPGDRLYYNYVLTYDQGSGPSTVRYNRKDGLILIEDGSGFQTNYTFDQMTEEELQWYLSGPEQIPGEWVSRTVGHYDEITGELIEEENDTYTLTVDPNGSYLAFLEQNAAGSWEYRGYDKEMGHSYWFTVSGGMTTYEFTLDDDGILQIFQHVGEEFVLYSMVKK